MQRRRTLLMCAAGALLAAGCGDSGDSRPPAGSVGVRVLSSTPQQVSGGDARIEVRAPRAGRVIEVSVASGVAVATGAALLRLE